MKNNILIVTDLDDTLLNKNSELSEELINYVHYLNTKPNVHFCLATGRTWEDTKVFYDKLNLNTPVICSNGCYIHHPKDINFQPLVFNFSFIYLCDFLTNPVLQEYLEIMMVVYDANKIERVKKELINDYFIDLQKRPYHPKIQSIWFRTISKELSQIFYKELKNVFDGLKVFVWDTNGIHKNIEIRVPYVNKGIGVSLLKYHLCVKDNDIYTFGDNFNDIEMLEKKCNSYAMANSSAFVKGFAKNITDNNHHENGVLNELKKIFSED